MDLSALLPALDQAVDLDRLRRRMSEDQREPLVLGVSDGAKAAVIAALRSSPSPSTERGPGSEVTLIVTPKPHHADALAEELTAWLGADGARVLVFPERDALPYERLAPDPDDVRRRLDVLDLLATAASPSPIAERGPGGEVRGESPRMMVTDARSTPPATASSPPSPRPARRHAAAASSTSGRRPKTSRCASSSSATTSRASARSIRRRSARRRCATSCASAPRVS